MMYALHAPQLRLTKEAEHWTLCFSRAAIHTAYLAPGPVAAAGPGLAGHKAWLGPPTAMTGSEEARAQVRHCYRQSG